MDSSSVSTEVKSRRHHKNTDFDDLESAIRSGYFLKEGIANNEDFYYMNILLTITGDSADELEWRVSEMKKLMLSQDLDVFACNFNQEQAFLSALPLVSLNKSLYERSKRNVLTMGAASCYPFTHGKRASKQIMNKSN